MGATLTDLPPELLAQVSAYFESAQALSQLSLTCRKIYRLVQTDGFRAFVQNQFPSIAYHLHKAVSENPGQCSSDLLLRAPSFWKDAAHSLTSLSHNLDRRAFVAQSIGPYDGYSQPNKNRQRSRRYVPGQTMGLVPIIDSYEEWNGGDWVSRKQVVAWGAGADLVIRVKQMGSSNGGRPAERNVPIPKLDSHGHRSHWITYREEGTVDGRDDITTLNLLPQSASEGREEAIMSRANGRLTKISLSAVKPRSKVPTTYVTNGRPVRLASLQPQTNSLVATCLSDSALALFDTTKTDSFVSALAETSVLPQQTTGRTWSTRFLTKSRLAVGYGPSVEPLKVYDLGRGVLDESSAQKVNIHPGNRRHATSIYSLAPLSGSLAGGADGDLFLSGGYDGRSRLHDLRCYNTVSTFEDPIDTIAAVYSLLPIGRERFFAGGALHSLLKLFDLRMPGGRVYYATDLNPLLTTPEQTTQSIPAPSPSQQPQRNFPTGRKRSNPDSFPANGLPFHLCATNPLPPTPPPPKPTSAPSKSQPSTQPGWSFYLGRNEPSSYYASYRTANNTAVYSLSSPSPASPTIFAGIESIVLQMDIAGVMDKYPDPVFAGDGRVGGSQQAGQGQGGSQQRGPGQAGPISVGERWDAQGRVVGLHAYRHDVGEVRLMKQRQVWQTVEQAGSRWDDRWIEC